LKGKEWFSPDKDAVLFFSLGKKKKKKKKALPVLPMLCHFESKEGKKKKQERARWGRFRPPTGAADPWERKKEGKNLQCSRLSGRERDKSESEMSHVPPPDGKKKGEREVAIAGKNGLQERGGEETGRIAPGARHFAIFFHQVHREKKKKKRHVLWRGS